MSRDLLPEEPCEPEPEPAEPDEASDLDFADMPCTDGDDGDDSRWEAFVPDEDESDPEPDPGDFWIENGRTDKETTRPGDKEEDDFNLLLPVSPAPCLLV